MKILSTSLIVILSFFFYNTLNAQITLTNSDGIVSTGVNVLTLPFTIPAGDEQLLLVTTGSDVPVLSVTYNSIPMTFVQSFINSAIWYTILGNNGVPSPGTIELTTLINGDYLGIAAFSFDGVDQTTPVENPEQAAILPMATSSSVTVASSTNDLVFDGLVVGCLLPCTIPTVTEGPGQTTLNNQSGTGMFFAGRGVNSSEPGAASVDMTWTFSGTTDAGGDHLGINIKHGTLPAPPSCTIMTNPLAGAVDVDVDADINWAVATGSPTGYKLTIGTQPGSGNLFNNFDLGNVTTFDPGTLPFDSTIYVTIVPYNAGGDASGCLEESFTVGTCTIGSVSTWTGGVSTWNVTNNWDLNYIPHPCNEVEILTGEAKIVNGTHGRAKTLEVAAGAIFEIELGAELTVE